MSGTHTAPGPDDGATAAPPPPPAPDTQESPTTPAKPPPPMALRTYRMLRLTSVAVIALLGVSIALEVRRVGCLQDSISAYYYTGVQSVFVGTLLALGLVMVVLWGKDAFEDGVLNLAGIMAPVVAFAPTGEPDVDQCGLRGAKDTVISRSEIAVDNNIGAYLIIIAAMLAILGVIGLIALGPKKEEWTSLSDKPKNFWIPWALAAGAWGFGLYKFQSDRDWYYEGAHKTAAITLFVFIVAVVAWIGWQKKKEADLLGELDATSPDDDGLRKQQAAGRWARGYWALAGVMVLGVPITFLGRDQMDHPVLFIEAWMIGWLAVFWLLQTWDRWEDGAPRPEADQTAAPAGAGTVP